MPAKVLIAGMVRSYKKQTGTIGVSSASHLFHHKLADDLARYGGGAPLPAFEKYLSGDLSATIAWVVHRSSDFPEDCL